mmetsp:Transcript_34642/g.58797  ORF Transcript_34642/g.58797 Transcript_34642/m.58797 type:complete len:181 (+) Transcript_34642:613-1155(+)
MPGEWYTTSSPTPIYIAFTYSSPLIKNILYCQTNTPQTFQCDCDPGFCLSANQQCYDGCTTHLDFNPFGGCRPGIDCPWFPDKLGGAYCSSSANFAGIYNLHETAEICCQEHFSAQNVNTCVAASVADVEFHQDLVQDQLARPRYYYPDLHGKKNCVFDSAIIIRTISSSNSAARKLLPL